MTVSYDKLLQDYRNSKGLPLFSGRLLALDPGETTGTALFVCNGYSTVLEEHRQLVCYPVDKGVVNLQSLVTEVKPTFMVYERYIVYSWKSAKHSWNKLETAQMIGSIRLIAINAELPTPPEQSAQEAKAFVTDEKLQEWGFYIKGKKHTRDAVRHGLYWLMFHKSAVLKSIPVRK